MKKTFTLYHEILDIPNTSPISELFPCENVKEFEDSIHDGPSKLVLNNILSYAKALSVFKTKNTGNVNIVLN